MNEIVCLESELKFESERVSLTAVRRAALAVLSMNGSPVAQMTSASATTRATGDENSDAREPFRTEYIFIVTWTNVLIDSDK